MKTRIKIFFSTILSLCLILATVCPTTAASTGDVMPLYNNTSATATNMNINDNGLMTISYQYSGYPSKTTKAVITTYIEKRTLGIFWSRVDIGTDSDQWVDVINDYRYTGYRTFQLSAKGTYRVVVNYTIYGTGGAADVIPYEAKDSY